MTLLHLDLMTYLLARELRLLESWTGLFHRPLVWEVIRFALLMLRFMEGAIDEPYVSADSSLGFGAFYSISRALLMA